MKPEGEGWTVASEHPDATLPYTLWKRLIPRDPGFAPGMQFYFDIHFEPFFEAELAKRTKKEEQRMEFDGTEYNAEHFMPVPDVKRRFKVCGIQTEPSAEHWAAGTVPTPSLAWESFELKKNETCKCPAPTVHGPEGFPGFMFEGVRYCYDCSRVIAPVNPVKCYTGEPMSALRELVIVVDHLRKICEHCEGKNKTEAKNLTAGMSLGIKTAHKYGKMLPDFERATFRADTLMVICNPVGVPNPGSDAAIALGCTCPVMDNNHGRGCNGEFWRTDGCPVHCPQ